MTLLRVQYIMQKKRKNTMDTTHNICRIFCSEFFKFKMFSNITKLIPARCLKIILKIYISSTRCYQKYGENETKIGF